VDPEKGWLSIGKLKRYGRKWSIIIILFIPLRSENAMSDGAFSGYSAQQGSTFGIGGSMARFGLYNDYLYAVDHSTLYMFDVKNDDANPHSIGKQNVGWDVETMFIYDGHMFFGTQTGMLIYNLDVATVPKYVGQFWHITVATR
jgi:hypothetical protein